MASEDSECYDEVFGMDKLPRDATQLKVLYTNDTGCACCTRWSEYADPVLESAILNQKLAGYSIIQRMKKDTGGHGKSGQTYTTHSIILRGAPLMDLARKLFDGYLGLDLMGTEITIVAPFKPIVHRWTRLEKIANSSEVEGGQTFQLAKVILDLFQPLVARYLAALKDARSLRTIPFSLLWTLFGPGDIVTTEKLGCHLAFKIISLNFRKAERSKPDWWTITYESVDWNGNTTGFVTGSTDIREDKTNENLSLSALPILPLSLHDNESALTAELLARGRKFERLRGYQYKMCSGKKLVRVHGECYEMPASGRVVIDAFAYYKCQNVVTPNLRLLNEKLVLEPEPEMHHHANAPPPPDFDQFMHPYAMNTHTQIAPPLPIPQSMPSSRPICGFDTPPPPPPPAASDSRYRNQPIPEQSILPITKEKPLISASLRVEMIEPMTDEQCILANPLLKGFDMKDKRWYEFYVDEISDIEWNNTLFSKLVLPEGEKDLALAFVKHKNATKVDVDFVSGKGRGLVILLFGPAGVGKTFTAEAVAEECHLPLYSMCARDLGTRAKDVEDCIDAAFDCCALWGCILLLDEADVFMSARTNESLKRNELVSIFLRRMEQYEGILFLTTNRAKCVDPAFQSRIDLILPYSDLTVSARREVWRNFINHAGSEKFEVREEDINSLANLKLNGREIKNLLKSAQYLMLKEQSSKVTVEHLERLAMMRMRAQKVLADD